MEFGQAKPENRQWSSLPGCSQNKIRGVHFRSESYAKAISNSIAGESSHLNGAADGIRSDVKRSCANSSPSLLLQSCTLTRNHLTDTAAVTESPRKSRTASLSNFFRKISPKLRPNSPVAPHHQPNTSSALCSKSKPPPARKPEQDNPGNRLEIRSNSVDRDVGNSVCSTKSVPAYNAEKRKSLPSSLFLDKANLFTLSPKKKPPLPCLVDSPSGNEIKKSAGSTSSTNPSGGGRTASKLNKLTQDGQFLFKLSPKKVLHELSVKHLLPHHHQQPVTVGCPGGNSQAPEHPNNVQDTEQKSNACVAANPEVPCSSSAPAEIKFPPSHRCAQKTVAYLLASKPVNHEAAALSQPPLVRLRRTRQPPHTLNILNKIVVHPPEGGRIARKISSVESIGQCSLDIDATASESSGTADICDGQCSSVSQRTLHSASVELSCMSSMANVQPQIYNQEASTIGPKNPGYIVTKARMSSPPSRVGNQFLTGQVSGESRYRSELYIPNGALHSRSQNTDTNGGPIHEESIKSAIRNWESLKSPGNDESTKENHKQPSYVNISCSVSGYSSFSRYSSKGVHSRENSPARANFNTVTNGHVKAAAERIHNKNNVSYSELIKDRSVRGTSVPPGNRSPLKNGDVTDASTNRFSVHDIKWNSDSSSAYTEHNIATSSSSFQIDTMDKSYVSCKKSISDTTNLTSAAISNGTAADMEASPGHRKSLIQQRIERLYGPGALAQGFRLRREKRYVNGASTITEKTVVSATNGQEMNGHNTRTAYHGMVSSDNTHESQVQKTSVVSELASVSLVRQTMQKQPRLSSESEMSAPVVNGNGHHDSFECQPNHVSTITLQVLPDEQFGQSFKASLPCISAKDDEELLPEQVPLASNYDSDIPSSNNEEVCPTNINGTKQDLGAQGDLKAGYRFIDTMDAEEAKIRELIATAETDLSSGSLPEDACGRLRAAIGKANLLLTQKFVQFRGLCQQNIDQRADEAFPTTESDLAGFWDMTIIQVGDIYQIFDEIEKLRKSGWVMDEQASVNGVSNSTGPKVKRSTVKKPTMSVAPQRSAKAEEAARAREEARKRLMEAKRKARQANTEEQPQIDGVEIYTPEKKEPIVRITNGNEKPQVDDDSHTQNATN